MEQLRTHVDVFENEKDFAGKVVKHLIRNRNEIVIIFDDDTYMSVQVIGDHLRNEPVYALTPEGKDHYEQHPEKFGFISKDKGQRFFKPLSSTIEGDLVRLGELQVSKEAIDRMIHEDELLCDKEYEEYCRLKRKFEN